MITVEDFKELEVGKRYRLEELSENDAFMGTPHSYSLAKKYFLGKEFEVVKATKEYPEKGIGFLFQDVPSGTYPAMFVPGFKVTPL